MKYDSKFPLLIFIISSIFSNPVFSTDNLVKEERIQERVKTVEEMKDMDEKVKTHLLDIYSKILDYLDASNTNNQQSTFFETTRKQSPEEIKQLEEELAKQEQLKQESQAQKSSQQILAKINKLTTVGELEQAYGTESANLAAVVAKNSDLKRTLNLETNSAPAIRKRIVEINRLLEQRQEEKNLPLTNSNPELNKAEQWLQDVEIESLRSEIKMLDHRLLSQPARIKTLKLKAELSDHKIKRMESYNRQLKQHFDLKRSSEIKQTQEMTLTELSEARGKHPLIESLAHNNTSLSEVITQRGQELIELEASDDSVFEEMQRIKDEKVNIKKKLDIAGLNQILGKVLWEQKQALPDNKQYQKDLKKREHIITQLGLEHINYQEEMSNIKDREGYLTKLLVDIPPETVSVIQDDLIKLIKTRRTLLQKVIVMDEKYLRAMSELDFSEKKLINMATDYSELIDKHLFWLRSATVLNLDNFKDAPEQIEFALNPSRWLQFVNDLFIMSRSSYQVILGFLLFIFLLIKRVKIEGLLTQIGLKTKKISTDSMLHTWKAIFYTLLRAIPVPMLLWTAGWQLANMPEISIFSHAVANGMLIITFPLFSLILCRKMCIPDGLFEMHFKWSSDFTKGLRKEMGRLMLTFIPIIFIVALMFSTDETRLNSGLGRLFILFTVATFAVSFYYLLKPQTGLLASVSKRTPQSFFARYQTLFFLLGMMTIAFLIGATIIGYVYTAGRVTALLIYSIWFIFSLVILQQMSVRWLLLTRRRYALKIAYEKRQEMQAQKQEQGKQDSLYKEDDDDDAIEIEEPEIDIISLSEDSQKLLNLALFILTVSGFVLIWTDVLPALSIFEKITLWHREGIVDGTMKLVPVTLGDLGLAVLILILTVVGAKRFPAIIEILLLQNNKISSGERYTITTLTNYTILGVGFFILFNIMGADWNRFQWLFAALSVGIGFGLQEIVANFISGLIILFERPIRVGDHISVGQNEGIVSRIQIRATTITTFDRKELLVPNKEFITGQLVNLSLSDPVARVVISVGVAYGSEIPKAKQLMLEAAMDSERILDEPVPTVMFRDFGDNSLNLELRCFVANVANRISIISEINEAINEKFNSAGICIAFPQRDIHLDINQPIDIRLEGKPE